MSRYCNYPTPKGPCKVVPNIRRPDGRCADHSGITERATASLVNPLKSMSVFDVDSAGLLNILESSGWDHDVCRDAVQRSDVTAEALDRIADVDDIPVRLGVASHANTATGTLHYLTRDPSVVVRAVAARHPNTAANDLESLADETDDRVLLAIAENPNSPGMALEYALENADYATRAYAAVHPNLTENGMRFLAKDQEAQVRVRVAKRTDAPEHLLSELAADEDRNVSEAALMNLEDRGVSITAV